MDEATVSRLLYAPNATVTARVVEALNAISPGAHYGLQGIEAGYDGVTKPLWDQAVMAAEDQEEDELNEQRIAARVASCILIINGYAEPLPARDTPGADGRDRYADGTPVPDEPTPTP